MEKGLTIASLSIAGLVTLIFLLDLAIKIPFNRVNVVLDVMFILGGAFVLWQGYETYREFR